jgi:hypothetical protein
MKFRTANEALLILILLLVSGVHDLQIKRKTRDFRKLKRKNREDFRGKFKEEKKEKNFSLKARDNQNQRHLFKSKKSSLKLHKRSLSSKRISKSMSKKLLKSNKLSQVLNHRSRTHSDASNRKSTDRNLKSSERNLSYSAYDYVTPYLNFKSMAHQSSSFDSTTLLIFVILIILMVTNYLKPKTNRKLDDSPNDKLRGLNIMDFFLGGTDLRPIIKSEKKKIKQYIKDNNLQLDNSTPFKDIVRLTKNFLKKSYHVDPSVVDKFKPVLKELYRQFSEVKNSKAKGGEEPQISAIDVGNKENEIKEGAASSQKKRNLRKIHSKNYKEIRHHQTNDEVVHRKKKYLSN